ncbi:MAG: NADH-quinone oxidoreductase subunit NuoN [Gammaproteobacteria bacterium]|nr:MAG: NADH-quinone oxidoreductase subunit NuoN [Gammaproteobacteria bacterium]
MPIPVMDFTLIAPEIFILLMACLILVVDAYIGDDYRDVSYVLTQVTFIVAAWLTWGSSTGETEVLFSGTYVRDAMGDVLKMFIYLASFVVFLYSRDYLKTRKLFKGEFQVLGLFAVLGMMVLVSAHSLLTVYLGLELLSLSLYAMVAFNRDSAQSCEAAMKYFVLGALASGLLLYGMSILYGTTGSLDLEVISNQVAALENPLPAMLALMFIIAAIAFKLGAVPFHMWIPDVYHGASTPVTLFLGTAPKLAAFALAMRLLVDGLEPLYEQWRDVLILLAVLSLAIGNIVAIAQTNIKRMLAYSTISHVGFLLLGILAGNAAGYSASMFYAITYVLMALGAFGMILLLSRSGFEAEELEDFKGLNDKSPWFAFMMLILMFSMAGVPPTVGFYSKLLVLRAIIDVDLIWLAAYAVTFAVIGVFYYLRVVRLMYFDKPVDTSAIESRMDMRMALSINSLAILLLGIFPGSLIAICIDAIS